MGTVSLSQISADPLHSPSTPSFYIMLKLCLLILLVFHCAKSAPAEKGTDAVQPAPAAQKGNDLESEAVVGMDAGEMAYDSMMSAVKSVNVKVDNFNEEIVNALEDNQKFEFSGF